MGFRVVTPPEPALTVDQIRAHLRMERTGDAAFDEAVDADLDLKGLAAQGAIDGPAGWLGRCIGLQTIEERFGDFLGNPSNDWGQTVAWECGLSLGSHSDTIFRLPFGPVRSVVSIKYLDQTNALITLDPALYELDTDEGRIRPVFGQQWPAAYDALGAVRIQYQAGYAPGEAPAPILAALLMMVADLNEQRDAKAQANLVDNPTVARLLAPYRSWR